MGLNSPEKQLGKLQEIQLGQEFSLFDPLYTKTGPEDGILFERKFALMLGVNDLPELHLRSEIFLLEDARLHGILLPFSPFNPEKGYVVTKEDLNPTAREKKRIAIFRQTLLTEPSKGEYVLLIGGDTFLEKYSAETIGILDRLRIRLSIGRMLLEGKRGKFPHIEKAGEIPFIEFSIFYPADTGELAPNFHGVRGQAIYLPNSTEKLSQIRAKFVLAEEEPVEKEG